jgi:hypothetical protein
MPTGGNKRTRNVSNTKGSNDDVPLIYKYKKRDSKAAFKARLKET